MNAESELVTRGDSLGEEKKGEKSGDFFLLEFPNPQIDSSW